MTERAFRNAVALSLLLIGLALVFYAIGGALAFAADAASLSIQRAELYDTAFRLAVFIIAMMYFFIGLSLISSRPRYTADAPPAGTGPARTVGPAGLMAARTFGIILFMLGVILLFDFTPYGRDTTLAAVMILAGVFGVAGTIMYAKPDRNVGAVGAVLGIIAAAMLLYAQITVRVPAGPSNTYGAWETTNLVVPPVLGPIAIMVACVCGMVYAYVRSARGMHVSFIGLGVAALVYGVGLCLVGLASVFSVPWYQFSQTAGNSTLQLIALVAGTAVLVAGGVACIVAALISFVRTARGIQEASTPTAPSGEPIATTSAGYTTDAPPPAPEASAGGAVAQRRRSRVRRRSTRAS